MSEASSVTLIFYRVGKQWWKEPALNLLAAAAQRSAYTHVELAIGDDALDDGSMTNVVRIFVRRAPTFCSAILRLPTISEPPSSLSAERPRRSGQLRSLEHAPAPRLLFQLCMPLITQTCAAFTGSHKPHRPQPAVLVRVPRLQQGRGAAHAGVCTAADWQAVQQRRDGALAHLAAANRRDLVVLRRCKPLNVVWQLSLFHIPLHMHCAELVAAVLKVGGLMCGTAP